MGKIDGKRVAIRGGSAGKLAIYLSPLDVSDRGICLSGGYTTLACLTDSKVFSAGVSLYGVADLKLLADDTHKVRGFALCVLRTELMGSFFSRSSRWDKTSS